MRSNRTLKWLVVFQLVVLAIVTYFNVLILKPQIPNTPNTEFRITAYMVDDMRTGEIRFALECLDSGIVTSYYIDEGKLYFHKFIVPNVTSPDENQWIGGITDCNYPDDLKGMVKK